MKRFGLIIGFILVALSTKAQYNDDFYLCFDPNTYKHYLSNSSSEYSEIVKNLSSYYESADYKYYELNKAIKGICGLCGYWEYHFAKVNTNSFSDSQGRLKAWILAAEIYCTAYCDPVSAGGNYEKEYLDAIQRCKQLCTKELDPNGRYAKEIEEIENLGMYKQCVNLYTAHDYLEAEKLAKELVEYYREKKNNLKVIEIQHILDDCAMHNNPNGTVIAKDDGIRHGKKKYKGQFSMSGLGFYNSSTRTGTAIYEYNDAPDGTRIFEGSFYYIYKERYLSDEVTGVYLNNKQVGTWKWDSERDEKEGIEVTINFNENGILDGTFRYVWGPYSTFENGDRSIVLERELYKGEYQAGKLKHLRYFSQKDGIEAEGDFSTVYPGTPVGKWKIRRSNRSVTIEFDNQGRPATAYYFDPSTGDKHSVSLWFYECPKEVYKYANNTIRMHCYRDTPKP